ncbi:MAG: alcohol dehydrogenase catalytic domain-containing protein [Halobacteriaceae archaeon]
MASMQAVVLEEWGGDLSVQSVDRPSPGATEVVVDVQACGVTRTIENAIQGGLSDDPALTPRIPGHEFAGVVSEVGDAVDAVEVGDGVLAYFYLVCGSCEACRRGDTAQCLEMDGWVGVHREGAYAEQAVMPAANVLPLPDQASYAAGAVATDGLATPIHVCDRAGIDDTDTLLIVGAAGRVGIHLAQLAALRGAHVLAADVTDDRLAHVDEYTPGHVTPIDARGEAFAERVRAETPYRDGPTVVVDTVGDKETLETAWETLAMDGRLVSLTTHHDRALDRPLREFVERERAVLGSRYATKDEVVRAARLLADGRIDPVITDTVDLEAVPAVHDALHSGETAGMTVLDPTR